MENAIKNNGLRYIIYCRKSSDSEDKQIASLPEQIKELTEKATKEGLQVVDILQESRSAFHTGRPKFEEMMSRIDKGEANAILVWASNRVARNMSDGGRFIYKFDEGRLIELRTKSGSFHNTPEDKFALSIDFSVAKKSSDDLSEAVKRGNRYKFFDLKEWGGCAKPGYKNYTDPVTKANHITSDGKRFRLLREALVDVAKGKLRPMEALHRLNVDRKYKTRPTAKLGGKSLSKAAFYRILTNPFYYGLMVRRIDGKVCEIKGTHPPMISQDDFNRIQIRIGNNGPKVRKINFPFKSVLKCGECGGSVTCEEKWQMICTNCKKKFHKGDKTIRCPQCGELIAEMNNPKVLHYVFYHCTKRVHNNCSQGSVSYEDLKTAIKNELDRYEIPDYYRDWAIEHLQEVIDDDITTQTVIKENLIEQFNLVTKNIANLVRVRCSKDYIDPTIQEAYDEEEKKLAKDKRDIERRLEEWSLDQDKWVIATKETFNFSCFAKYWFEQGDPETKTWVLSKLGQNLILEGKKLHISGDIPFYLIEKMKNGVRQELKRLEPDKIPQLSKESLTISGVSNTVRSIWVWNLSVLMTMSSTPSYSTPCFQLD